MSTPQIMLTRIFLTALLVAPLFFMGLEDAHAQSGVTVTSGMGGGASSTARLQAQVTQLQQRLANIENCGAEGRLFGGNGFTGAKTGKCITNFYVLETDDFAYAPTRLRVGSTAAPVVPLDVTGAIRASGDIQSLSRFTTSGTSGEKFLIGNDATLHDIDVANTVGLYGQQNAAVATIRLGNSGGAYIAGASDNVGIGTTSPSEKLHIAGNARVTGRIGVAVTSPSHPLHVSGNGYLTGNVGIGAAPTSNRLHVSGVGNFTDRGRSNNGFYHTSDRSQKENINPLTNALERVRNLKPVTYTMKGGDRTQAGFIAQDVETLFPEVVSTDKDGIKSIDYSKMVAHLAGAVQEQNTLIEAQASALTGLRTEIAKLQKQIHSLEAQVKANTSK